MVRKNWIYPVFLFLVVGMTDAVYLSYHHYLVNLAHPESASFCTVNSVVDCDQVATSRFSTLFGIPVAILGFFSYSFLAIFLLFGFVKRSDSLKEICSLVTLFSILMFLFAMYEATVSVFLLGKICLMCSILYGCGIGLLISSRRSIALPFRQVLGIAGGSLIGLFSRSERKSCLGSILFAFGISLLLSVATDYGLQRHFAKKEAADEVSARSALRQGMEFMNRNREKEGVVTLPGRFDHGALQRTTGGRYGIPQLPQRRKSGNVCSKVGYAGLATGHRKHEGRRQTPAVCPPASGIRQQKFGKEHSSQLDIDL